MNNFSADFRALLNEHGITAPRFAHGSSIFDPKKPRCLYSGPLYDQEELVAGVTAFVEGQWSIAGEYIRRFEREFSHCLGQKETVVVNSGSSADLILLAAAKLRHNWADGAEIIVSPAGFPTTISAITLNRLTPVFTDIEWKTLNADNDLIEKRLIERGKKVVAVFVSPVLGNPPNLEQLQQLCIKHNVLLLMDGCDSLGSTWTGRPLSDCAYATTCSFFPSHHISILNGGSISSNDVGLIALVRQLITWGRSCKCFSTANMLPNGICGERFKVWLPDQPDLILDHRYIFGVQGYNLQPLDLQGALGLAQLKKADFIHRRRREIYKRLTKALSQLSFIKLVDVYPESDPSWFGIPIICSDYAHKLRLVNHFESNGIQTRNYFAGNILQHPGYKNLDDYSKYPNANEVLRKVFFIGTNPGWSEAHLEHIERTIDSFRDQT